MHGRTFSRCAIVATLESQPAKGTKNEKRNRSDLRHLKQPTYMNVPKNHFDPVAGLKTAKKGLIKRVVPFEHVKGNEVGVLGRLKT